MWSLAKSLFGLVILLVMAYGLFFVDLGGKPLAGHLEDIWRSPAVQAKTELVRSHLRNELEDRLAAVAERQTRKAVRETLGPRPDDVEERDRAALEDLIARTH